MKWLLAVFIVGLIFFSCTRKAAPTIPERPVEPVTGNKPDTADLASSNPLIAGEAIYKIQCTKCHAAKPVANWTATEWVPILNAMVKKAALNEKEIEQVTLYVNSNAKK